MQNPILFGISISRKYKKWAISALILMFFATAFSRFSVIILRNLTDSLATNPIDINSVWMWALGYAILFLISENIWRLSGYTGMHWFMNFRFSGYQSLYEYLTLHSKDYFNSRFAGSLANKISHAVNGTQTLFERMLWNFLPLLLGLFWFTGFSFFSNFLLGLIMIIWTILFLIINVIFAKKMHPRSFQSAKAGSTLKGRIVDSLSNISLVHEYAYVRKTYDTATQALPMKKLKRLQNLLMLMNLSMICQKDTKH